MKHIPADNLNCIDSEEKTYPWNIDGDLVEWATEVHIRYDYILSCLNYSCW